MNLRNFYITKSDFLNDYNGHLHDKPRDIKLKMVVS